jgi:hypothetical protein
VRWAVVAVVGLGVLAAAAGLWLFRKRPSPAAPHERRPLLVRRSGAGAYRTVREALLRAQRGDVIELLDDRVEENVTVAPSMGKTEVTLRARPGKSVVWTFARGREKDPVLRLAGAAGFRLEGGGITLDGQDVAPRLLVLYGECPGLTVEGLRLRGFGRMAVHVLNCKGSAEWPVRLLGLRTLTVPKEKPGAAVYFEAQPNHFVTSNAYIEIDDRCTFTDLPPARAIQRENAKAIGPGVRLPQGYSW